MNNIVNREKFLEIINNSILIEDSNHPIFATDLKYKDIISNTILYAEENAQESIFDDTYTIKKYNDKIYFKLIPSNIKRKDTFGLNLLFFVSEESFLKKSEFKPIKKDIFIFDKKNNLKSFLDCYNFYIELKNFLRMLEVYYDSIDKKITLYFQRSIIVDVNISKLECNNITTKKETLKKIQDEFKNNSSIDIQTKKEFIKKAIYDNFTNQKKIFLTDVYHNLIKIFDEYNIVKRAYIDSLDTGKIKEDFKNKYQETLNFLNTIISNLYTKTLFIPITIIFGLSQKLSSNNTNHQFYIYLSLILFLIILSYLILGNINVLKNIKIQIDDLRDDIKIFSSFHKKIESINNLYKGVRNRIYGVFTITIISILLLSYIYLPIIKNFLHFK